VLNLLPFMLVVLVPAGLAIALWRRRVEHRLARSATVALHADGFGVRRELADGREEQVDWSEVQEVEVYRTHSGPHATAGGMMLLFGDDTRGCLVPLDRLDADGLIEGLTSLPGFKVQLLHEAVETPVPAQVVVWRRRS
jgi:hypothetical protein